MERLSDRLTAWVLRLVATAMLFAGLSVLVAGVPLFGMLTASPVARTIAGVLFQLSGVFVVAGGTAIYLSRPRGLLLPKLNAPCWIVGFVKSRANPGRNCWPGALNFQTTATTMTSSSTAIRIRL